MKDGWELLRKYRLKNELTHYAMVQKIGLPMPVLRRLFKGRVPTLLQAAIIHAGTDGKVPMWSWLLTPQMKRDAGQKHHGAHVLLAAYVSNQKTYEAKKGWAALQLAIKVGQQRFGWTRLTRSEWRTLTQPRVPDTYPPTKDERDD